MNGIAIQLARTECRHRSPLVARYIAEVIVVDAAAVAVQVVLVCSGLG